MYAINLRKPGGYFRACFVAVITLGLFMPQAFAADIIVARYEAEGPLMFHQAGSAITGAWRINQSGSTYSTFGPYELEKIPYGSNIQLKARFRLRVDNNIGTTNVCTLDVMRSRYRPGTLGDNGTILGTPLTLKRNNFSAANTWQNFDVTFNYAKDSGYETRIEFRTQYLGNNTQLDQDYVEVIYVVDSEPIKTASGLGTYTYTFDPELDGATKFNADTVHPNTYVQDDGDTSMVWCTDNAAAVGFCQWHFNAGSGRTFSSDITAYSKVSSGLLQNRKS